MTCVARWIRNLCRIWVTITRDSIQSFCCILYAVESVLVPSLLVSFFSLFLFLILFFRLVRSYIFSNTFTFTTRQLHLFRKLFALQICSGSCYSGDVIFSTRRSVFVCSYDILCALFPLVTVCLPSLVFNHISNFSATYFFFSIRFFFQLSIILPIILHV